MKSPTSTASETMIEQHAERERMQDVVLLLDHLFSSQDTTLRLIIDCLYYVGAVSWINYKIKPRWLAGVTKRTAALSKPVFRRLALYWVKHNCSTLVAKWLHRKITVGDRVQLDISREVMAQALAEYEQRSRPSPPSAPMDAVGVVPEVKQLRGEVRRLQGMLIGSLVMLGGAASWIIYEAHPDWAFSQSSQPSFQDIHGEAHTGETPANEYINTGIHQHWNTSTLELENPNPQPLD